MSEILELNKEFQEYVIDTDLPFDLNIIGKHSSDVLLRIKNGTSINITSNISENADITVLLWNESNNSIEFNENYTVDKDSNLKIAYGDLNNADIKRTTNVSLIGTGASALVKSACLCKNKKKYSILVNSKVPYTSGEIENYSVVLNGGNYRMDATGQIEKGAFQSNSHQTSRALSFDENQVSTIIPKLIIDENDVMASHATSVGRVDDNQMVYMQSRGLSVSQVMALVSTGYLLPIADFIKHDELRESLRNDIERMVNQECLI